MALLRSTQPKVPEIKAQPDYTALRNDLRYIKQAIEQIQKELVEIDRRLTAGGH